MKRKIVLIDGHNLLFRMFFGIPASIKNSKNMEIRGLVGFIGSLKQIVSKFNPYSMVVIFDSETSRYSNLQLDEMYKDGRDDYTDVAYDDSPFSQLPLIYKALDYLNIPYLEVEDNEADDFIASIINDSGDSNCEYIIVSTDSDFIQLVDSNTFLYVPRGKNSILYDEKEVFDKYGVLPNKYVIFKALTGDKSDNIIGIKGIGKVTASRILEYDSIENYINNNKNCRIAKILMDNNDKINKNIGLITLNKYIDTSSVCVNKICDLLCNSKTYEIIEAIGEK